LVRQSAGPQLSIHQREWKSHNWRAILVKKEPGKTSGKGVKWKPSSVPGKSFLHRAVYEEQLSRRVKSLVMGSPNV